MDDLELTRRVAEAMGHTVLDKHPSLPVVRIAENPYVYSPLTTDADCFAIIKRFRLELKCVMETWHVWDQYATKPAVLNKDLNRAICLAVATTQEGKDG